MLKVAFHPIFKLDLPLGHRFPMSKYELLYRQLLQEGTCESGNFFTPSRAADSYILAVHTESYLKSLRSLNLDKKAARKIGFPLTEKLVEREYVITQGTIEGCDFALQEGIAMNIAGGTHHAYPDHGEAFCIFHDQAIGARYLQIEKGIKKILMLDLDVHQGNGTAVIFKDDPSVFTFSMHGAGNYPFRKEKSDLDIGLKDGTSDQEYLGILKEIVPDLIYKTAPDFIFYLSGVDILKTDKLGRLSCTMDGCRERDRFVLQLCKDHGIPVQISMGGGYSPDIKTIVSAHANTFRLVQEIYN